MELINKKMMVSDSPINEENKGYKYFVVWEMGGSYVTECEHTKKPIIWKYASPILAEKPQWESPEELKNHLDVWEYTWNDKSKWRSDNEWFRFVLMCIDYELEKATEIREIANPENRFFLRDCIIKKKTEPMTNRDIFNALKKEDCWLKYGNERQTNHWYSHWTPSRYKITYDSGKTWHELVKEV